VAPSRLRFDILDVTSVTRVVGRRDIMRRKVIGDHNATGFCYGERLAATRRSVISDSSATREANLLVVISRVCTTSRCHLAHYWATGPETVANAHWAIGPETITKCRCTAIERRTN
jgi:hypothetical protein